MGALPVVAIAPRVAPPALRLVGSDAREELVTHLSDFFKARARTLIPPSFVELAIIRSSVQEVAHAMQRILASRAENYIPVEKENLVATEIAESAKRTLQAFIDTRIALDHTRLRKEDRDELVAAQGELMTVQDFAWRSVLGTDGNDLNIYSESHTRTMSALHFVATRFSRRVDELRDIVVRGTLASESQPTPPRWRALIQHFGFS